MNKKLLLAATAGSIFEWYDFFLLGTLLVFLTKTLFPPGNESMVFLLGLAMFATGPIIRPLGALTFGYLADRIGRKRVFVTTVVLMGVFTTGIGLLPGFAVIGWLAPIMLIVLRIGQGFALGGEYGNAITYVYEHSKKEERGFYTSIVQTSVHFGLLLAFSLILLTQANLTKEEFVAWGWRIPFLIASLFLIASIWLRRTMSESPEFLTLVENNKISANPISESFCTFKNLKHTLIVVLGISAGMSAVVNMAGIYCIVFLLKTLRLDSTFVFLALAGAQILAIGLTIWIGALIDKIDKLKIVLVGLALSFFTLPLVFFGFEHYANPVRESVIAQYPIAIIGPTNCSVNLFLPQDNDCAKVKDLLNKNNIPYSNLVSTSATSYVVTVAGAKFETNDLSKLTTSLKEIKYIQPPGPLTVESKWAIFALICALYVLHSIVHAPVAIIYGDMFPVQIRSTSVSAVYHIANGWFGGLLPLIIVILNSTTGNPWFGLAYPLTLITISFIVILANYQRFATPRN